MLAGHCLLYIVTDICRRRSSSSLRAATLKLKCTLLLFSNHRLAVIALKPLTLGDFTF